MLTFVGLKGSKRLQAQAVDSVPRLSVLADTATEPTPEEILAEYRKDIADIDAYALAIMNMKITIYGEAPQWYNQVFKDKFVRAKTDAQSWLNDVMSSLNEVPNSIIGYDALYQMYAGEILECCKALLKKPSATLQKQVIDDIEKLYNSIDTRKANVSALETAISKYIALITVDKTFFDQAYQDACDTKDAEKEKLQQFEAKKQELEKEIKRIQDVIIGTSIAGGVALTAFPVCLTCGPVGIVIGVIALAAAIALLVTAIVESTVLNAKQAELGACVASMNDTTKTIQSLNVFTKQLDTIIIASKLAQSAAQEILGYWEELEDQMDQLLQDLKNGKADAQKKLYEALITEIENTNKEWQDIVEKAKLYAQVNIETSDKVVDIPQSA